MSLSTIPELKYAMFRSGLSDRMIVEGTYVEATSGGITEVIAARPGRYIVITYINFVASAASNDPCRLHLFPGSESAPYDESESAPYISKDSAQILAFNQGGLIASGEGEAFNLSTVGGDFSGTFCIHFSII